MKTINLQEQSVRELNQLLHDQAAECTEREWEVLEPKGALSTRASPSTSRGTPATSARA